MRVQEEKIENLEKLREKDQFEIKALRQELDTAMVKQQQQQERPRRISAEDLEEALEDPNIQRLFKKIASQY